MVYVYIIKSIGSEWIYVGISADLETRLDLHNSGKVRSTKARRPYTLLYKEELINYTVAREREKYFKTNAGKEWLRRRNLI